MTLPVEPALSYLMSFNVQVGEPSIIATSLPARRFIPILGGTVSGALTGRIRSGGGDWQWDASDGRIELNAHYVADIEGHGLVEVRGSGIRYASDGNVYFRTSMRFFTEAPDLQWLNRRLCISTGTRGASSVTLNIFELS